MSQVDQLKVIHHELFHHFLQDLMDTEHLNFRNPGKCLLSNGINELVAVVAQVVTDEVVLNPEVGVVLLSVFGLQGLVEV